MSLSVLRKTGQDSFRRRTADALRFGTFRISVLCRCQARAPRVLPAGIVRDVDVVGPNHCKPGHSEYGQNSLHALATSELGLWFIEQQRDHSFTSHARQRLGHAPAPFQRGLPNRNALYS